MLRKRRNQYFQKIDNSISLFFAGEGIYQSADLEYPFIVNKNFFYLTNIDEKNACLMLIKSDDLEKEILFIERQKESDLLWHAEKIIPSVAKEKSQINTVLYLDELDSIISSYMISSKINHFSTFNTFYLDFERHNHLSQNYTNLLKSDYPYAQFKNNYDIVTDLRTKKDTVEIENIKTAIKITKKAIENMMKNANANYYEYELESFYDQVLKYHNTTPSFKSIIAGGVNATILHYERNNQMIMDNSLVLCDVGCNYQNYSSDITRTFPINGKFTDRQKEVYQAVLETNKKAIAFLRPGITYEEYNEFGRKTLASYLEKLGLTDGIENYYYHSLGHSLGLDCHDGGNIGVIEENMIITVEPGLYIKEEGIGIRIEDDILITSDGAINLSIDIKKEIEDIENYMKKR